MRPATPTLLYIVDLLGTFLIAAEGALTATAASLDIFGVMVLAFATALAGGIIRDLLIGDVPPASIRNWRYAATAFAAAAIVFVTYSSVQQIPAMPILVLDAAGLGLFAIAGTQKALEFNLSPGMAILMGTITGVGGGTVRDVLLARIPMVLRADVYATAALAGATVLVLALRLKASPTIAAILGGVVCFALRMAAVWGHWNLPHLR
jgi:uncharacterized membrane protein YeiH